MAFKFGAWNIRGLNDPYKQRCVLELVRKENLRFFGLLETKIKIDNFDATFNKLLGNWDKMSNHNWSPLGRVCVCWDPLYCKVKKLNSSDQFILCEVDILDDCSTIYVCFVYAYNGYIQRRILWDNLKEMSNNLKDVPWLVIGDFNAIRYQFEKVGGDLGWSSMKEEFNSALIEAELDDLKYGGCQFTWSNK